MAGRPRKPQVGEKQYSISQAVKLFFPARGVQWLRTLETEGYFVREDGSVIDVGRTQVTQAKVGQRRYTATAMGEIADALYKQGKIVESELLHAKLMSDAFSLYDEVSSKEDIVSEQ